jgi:hypothetical protein
VSAQSTCPYCWAEGDISDLVAYAGEWIAAVTADLWPDSEPTFGPLTTTGDALHRQVRLGAQTLRATVRPAGGALVDLVRGHYGDLVTVVCDTGGADATVRDADQLTALATYSDLRVPVPTARAKGVMFTPWPTATSLGARLMAEPDRLTELLTMLMDDVAGLHRDPAHRLRRLATPPRGGTVPRVVTAALDHPAEHHHAADAPTHESRELRALMGRVAARLRRLAAELDLFPTYSGIAFGTLTPHEVLYPDPSPRAILPAPDLGPGGETADTAILLGHLHLLALDSPRPVRAELAEGLEAWLTGRVALRRDTWRSWLTAVLTIWAATLYDTLVTAHTLPAAVPLTLDAARLRHRPEPVLAALDVLTGELRTRGGDSALNALLATLATADTDQAPAVPAPAH